MEGTGKTTNTTGVYDDYTFADLWHISEAVIYEYHLNDPGVYTNAELSLMLTYGHRQAIHCAE